MEQAIDVLGTTKLSVDEIKGQLTQHEKGGVKNTIQNCLTVLQNDEKLKGAIAFNMLSEKVDIVRKVTWDRTTTALNDTDLYKS